MLFKRLNPMLEEFEGGGGAPDAGASTEPEQTETGTGAVETATQETGTEEGMSSDPGAKDVEPADPQEEPKPTQTQEERARYAEQRRQKEKEIRDAAAADYARNSGLTYNGSPINDEATLNMAMEAQKTAQIEAEKKQTYGILSNVAENMGITIDELKEIAFAFPEVQEALESQKTASQKLAEIEAEKQKTAQNAKEFNDFLEYYKESNGREFDYSKDEIPPEVFETAAKTGKSLTDSYMSYENKQLKQKLENITKGEKAKESNAAKADITTGSVSTGESGNTGKFTREQVEAMSPAEVSKNLDKIMADMKGWTY